LRRSLFLIDQILLDVFEVSSELTVQMDWLAHAGVPKLAPAGEATPSGDKVTLGHKDGYQHFSDLQAWNATGDSQWEFVQNAKKKLRLWINGIDGQQILTGKRLGYHKTQKCPVLIRRLNSNRARFVTVYDLSGNASNIEHVNVSADGERIRTRDGEWMVRFGKVGIQANFEAR
ncbi:MAG: hypothetical protein QF886_25075, partial [Planctomycetota bacterium]|nr:hypothetical protein [Planctomycetota bacterium]